MPKWTVYPAGFYGKDIDQAIEKEKETVIDQLAVVFSFVSISCWISMIVASYLVFGLIGLAATILIGIFAPFPAKCVFCLISIVAFVVTLVAGVINGTLDSDIYTGGFGGGSSSGGWSSGGGGSSSGGSSFGGGSFGGGGASGGW